MNGQLNNSFLFLFVVFLWAYTDFFSHHLTPLKNRDVNESWIIKSYVIKTFNPITLGSKLVERLIFVKAHICCSNSSCYITYLPKSLSNTQGKETRKAISISPSNFYFLGDKLLVYTKRNTDRVNEAIIYLIEALKLVRAQGV